MVCLTRPHVDDGHSAALSDTSDIISQRLLASIIYNWGYEILRHLFVRSEQSRVR